MATTCRTPGEPCPQCNEADLRPHGNGSKWVCPRCHFMLPCCEGGDLSRAGPAAVAMQAWAPEE